MSRTNTLRKCGVLKSESDFFNGGGCCCGGDYCGSVEKGKGDRLKKFFKNKKIIGSLVTVLFLGFGVNHPGISLVVTDIYCEQVKCDA